MPTVQVKSRRVRRHRKQITEISCCLKYIIFGFNVIFWFIGFLILSVGMWAWSEKDTFRNLGRLANIALDPAFVMIIIGSIMFVIGLFGCIGALRENTCFLATYAIILLVLLLTEVGICLVAFIFRDWLKVQAAQSFQGFIVHYREDPDQQNLIDWIQEEWLQCCGIEGPKDWDKNNYFNCSSAALGSREACGVPFSCCKRKQNEVIENKQCGYDVRKDDFRGTKNIFEQGCFKSGQEWVETNMVAVLTFLGSEITIKLYDPSKIINEKGCVQAGQEWIERNMLSIAGFIIFTVYFQVLGICLAQNLRADIIDHKSKRH